MSESRRSRILVVDDRQDNLDLVCEVFEGDGYELLTARSAEAAIELVREQRPDVAILDVQMPEVDGYELCLRLRETLSCWELPILFLTAHCTSPQAAARGLDLGACDYVTKPFNKDELKARVRAALRGQRAHEIDLVAAKAVTRRLLGH
jgi:DNA-binding response OmpR family regulator